ncbi:MAG TPA: hypothetical protein VJ905_13170 [Halalkalibaculum sp.]|nr:hypothetical protein [Halalkalibaculum sp.]
MKKYIITALFCCTLLTFSQISYAQQSGVGLGAILNGPTGISVKVWLSEDLAVDGALGLQLSENFQSVYIHSDILYHNDSLNEELDLNNSSLRSYYGAGLRVVFQDFNDIVGLRFPVGLTYSLTNAPLGTFFELAPTFDIEPNFQFSFAGAIGLRYYLN